MGQERCRRNSDHHHNEEARHESPANPSLCEQQARTGNQQANEHGQEGRACMAQHENDHGGHHDQEGMTARYETA